MIVPLAGRSDVGFGSPVAWVMALPMRSKLARSSGSLMVAAMDRSSWAGISPPFMEFLMVWSRLIVLCTDIVHRFSRQLLDCFPCLSLHKTLCVPHVQRV